MKLKINILIKIILFFTSCYSIYQVGRYYYKNGIEYFTNTSLPYTISNSDIPYILDFENHLIVKLFNY